MQAFCSETEEPFMVKTIISWPVATNIFTIIPEYSMFTPRATINNSSIQDILFTFEKMFVQHITGGVIGFNHRREGAVYCEDEEKIRTPIHDDVSAAPSQMLFAFNHSCPGKNIRHEEKLCIPKAKKARIVTPFTSRSRF